MKKHTLISTVYSELMFCADLWFAVQPLPCSSVTLGSRRQQLKPESKRSISKHNLMLCLWFSFVQIKKNTEFCNNLHHFLWTAQATSRRTEDPSWKEDRSCISNLSVKKHSSGKLAFSTQKTEDLMSFFLGRLWSHLPLDVKGKAPWLSRYKSPTAYSY